MSAAPVMCARCGKQFVVPPVVVCDLCVAEMLRNPFPDGPPAPWRREAAS